MTSTCCVITLCIWFILGLLFRDSTEGSLPRFQFEEPTNCPLACRTQTFFCLATICVHVYWMFHLFIFFTMMITPSLNPIPKQQLLVSIRKYLSLIKISPACLHYFEHTRTGCVILGRVVNFAGNIVCCPVFWTAVDPAYFLWNRRWWAAVCWTFWWYLMLFASSMHVHQRWRKRVCRLTSQHFWVAEKWIRAHCVKQQWFWNTSQSLCFLYVFLEWMSFTFSFHKTAMKLNQLSVVSAERSTGPSFF